MNIAIILAVIVVLVLLIAGGAFAYMQFNKQTSELELQAKQALASANAATAQAAAAIKASNDAKAAAAAQVAAAAAAAATARAAAAAQSADAAAAAARARRAEIEQERRIAEAVASARAAQEAVRVAQVAITTAEAAKTAEVNGSNSEKLLNAITANIWMSADKLLGFHSVTYDSDQLSGKITFHTRTGEMTVPWKYVSPTKIIADNGRIHIVHPNSQTLRITTDNGPVITWTIRTLSTTIESAMIDAEFLLSALTARKWIHTSPRGMNMEFVFGDRRFNENRISGSFTWKTNDSPSRPVSWKIITPDTLLIIAPDSSDQFKIKMITQNKLELTKGSQDPIIAFG